MRFSEFMFLFVKSLNPGDYRMLVTRKKRDTIGYFLALLLFAVIVSFFFSIPKIMQMPDKIDSMVSKFDRFNITGIDAQTNEKIIIAKSPKIVLDLSGNETNVTDEYLLITKSDVYTKKFRPNLFEWKLFETENTKITEYGDVTVSFSKIKGRTYLLLYLLLLPSILLFTYVFNFIKYSLIIGAFTFAGFAIARIKGKKIKITAAWRAAVYSSTLMIMVEATVFQLFSYNLLFALLSIAIYFITFLLSMLALVEKDLQIKSSE